MNAKSGRFFAAVLVAFGAVTARLPVAAAEAWLVPPYTLYPMVEDEGVPTPIYFTKVCEPGKTAERDASYVILGIWGYRDGYHRRNNPLRREFGGVLQLGRKQITGVALLARVPNRYIDAACEVRPNMPIGDARHIEETYRQMAVDPTCEAWLLNPTLLIDFVDGGTGRIFPQVSFYWHGHSQESFFRAVVSPNRPNVIAPVVEFLNEHGYASLVSLYHHFAEQLGNVKYEDFREELNTACAQANPSMALVEEGEADRAWLTHTVYYSTAWMANQEHPSNLSNGEVIGRDLFRKIVGNHWNWFTKPWGATQIQPTNHAPNNGIGYLSYTLVDQAGYGKVMSYDFVRDVYNWMSFAQHYRTIE